MPKYKLAEYRYGREEMLALYIKDNKVSGKTTKFLSGLYESQKEKCFVVLKEKSKQALLSMYIAFKAPPLLFVGQLFVFFFNSHGKSFKDDFVLLSAYCCCF